MPDREADMIKAIADLAKVVNQMMDNIMKLAVRVKELESK